MESPERRPKQGCGVEAVVEVWHEHVVRPLHSGELSVTVREHLVVPELQSDKRQDICYLGFLLVLRKGDRLNPLIELFLEREIPGLVKATVEVARQTL